MLLQIFLLLLKGFDSSLESVHLGLQSHPLLASVDDIFARLHTNSVKRGHFEAVFLGQIGEGSGHGDGPVAGSQLLPSRAKSRSRILKDDLQNASFQHVSEILKGGILEEDQLGFEHNLAEAPWPLVLTHDPGKTSKVLLFTFKK